MDCRTLKLLPQLVLAVDVWDLSHVDKHNSLCCGDDGLELFLCRNKMIGRVSLRILFCGIVRKISKCEAPYENVLMMFCVS